MDLFMESNYINEWNESESEKISNSNKWCWIKNEDTRVEVFYVGLHHTYGDGDVIEWPAKTVESLNPETIRIIIMYIISSYISDENKSTKQTS